MPIVNFKTIVLLAKDWSSFSKIKEFFTAERIPVGCGNRESTITYIKMYKGYAFVFVNIIHDEAQLIKEKFPMYHSREIQDGCHRYEQSNPWLYWWRASYGIWETLKNYDLNEITSEMFYQGDVDEAERMMLYFREKAKAKDEDEATSELLNEIIHGPILAYGDYIILEIAVTHGLYDAVDKLLDVVDTSSLDENLIKICIEDSQFEDRKMIAKLVSDRRVLLRHKLSFLIYTVVEEFDTETMDLLMDDERFDSDNRIELIEKAIDDGYVDVIKSVVSHPAITPTERRHALKYAVEDFRRGLSLDVIIEIGALIKERDPPLDESTPTYDMELKPVGVAVIPPEISPY